MGASNVKQALIVSHLPNAGNPQPMCLSQFSCFFGTCMLQGMGGMVLIGYIEFNLPLAFRIPEAETFEEKAQAVRDFFMKNGFMDLLRKEYAKQGLYLLDIHTYGPVHFVLSTKPVKTCSDLKGLKIKADGGNMTYHNDIGMQIAQISPTETYMALKLGTVDLAEWDLSCVTGMKPPTGSGEWSATIPPVIFSSA